MIADTPVSISQSYAARADEDYIGAPWFYESDSSPEIWVLLQGAGTSPDANVIQSFSMKMLTQNVLSFQELLSAKADVAQEELDVETELFALFSPQLGQSTFINILPPVPGKAFAFVGDTLLDSDFE